MRNTLVYRILRRIKRMTLAVWARVRSRFRYGRFDALKIRAQGMLQPAVYQHLYRTIADLPDLDVVEIGGASGASSIAMAWALQEQSRVSKLIVVEKCEGGSRSYYGDYATNYGILTRNLDRYQVRDTIRLFPHHLTFDNRAEVLALIHTGQIAALIHDADGRIDRDFAIFWPRLIPNGAIIIDDYENTPEFRPVDVAWPDGGTKKLTTYRLLNQFMDWGLFALDVMVDGTAFGHKPPDADFGRLDLARCEAIIELIMDERRAWLASSQ